MSRKKNIITGIIALFLMIIAFAGYRLVTETSTTVKNDILQADKIFDQHQKDLWTAVFGNNDTLIASADVEGVIKVWRKDDGKVIHDLKQTAGITSIAFSSNGRQLLTAGYDEKIRLWDLAKEKVIKEFAGHKGTVWNVVFSPDNKTIASCGEDKSIKLWDAENGKLLKTFTGHSLNIWQVRFTPDGHKLVSSSFDNTIKMWDVESGLLIKTLTGHTEAVVGLALSPNGKMIASGSDDKTIKLWDIHSGTLTRTLIGGEEHVYSVAFSPDNKRLISGSRDKGTMGELIQNFFGDSHKNKGVSMRLWEVQSGKLLQTASEHANDVMSVSYSADGKWLVSAGNDNAVRLWRVTK